VTGGILVVNTGSSSLKASVLNPGGDVTATLALDRWDGSPDHEELSSFLNGCRDVTAAGHRVVHGGSRFPGPALIDDAVLAGIAELTDLAPLHQPRALAGIAAVSRALPGVPAVACFDTAFHATLPAAAAAYALPGEWVRQHGLRRYGFHGLSHAYASRRAAELLKGGPGLRVVTCHLGAGASLAAVRGGRSADTTMGFTPLEGLVMATRSGSVDPGLILWLLQYGGLTAGEVSDGLERRSGLAGLAGGTGDMRDVHAAAAAGSADAALAVQVYLHRLRREIAAMAAAMDGLDALAFTGGVGEHDPVIRAGTAAGLGFLGVTVDAARNQSAAGDADISAGGATVRTVVITAREDAEIARQTRAVVAGGPARHARRRRAG
jgi:acetate kinase